MLFKYEAITSTNDKKTGIIDAGSKDLAISAIQRRGLMLSSIKEANSQNSILDLSFLGMNKVLMKDVVIMSRQISTLFESQVSALKAFNLISENTENKALSFHPNRSEHELMQDHIR
jgi:type II secretory pathway component PulF